MKALSDMFDKTVLLCCCCDDLFVSDCYRHSSNEAVRFLSTENNSRGNHDMYLGGFVVRSVVVG